MGICYSCNSNDMYEITTDPKFTDNLEKTVLQYRFMVGKHNNNFTFSRIFKDTSYIIYDGSRVDEDKIYNENVIYKIDIRHGFIYGVYYSSNYRNNVIV
jgi:hypothetical protein